MQNAIVVIIMNAETPTHGVVYSNVRPLTASPAPSTSLPSSRRRIMGRSTGLARPICARSVGLERTPWGPQLTGLEPLPSDDGTIGDDAPELGGATGMAMGCGTEMRPGPVGVRGVKCVSR